MTRRGVCAGRATPPPPPHHHHQCMAAQAAPAYSVRSRAGCRGRQAELVGLPACTMDEPRRHTQAALRLHVVAACRQLRAACCAGCSCWLWVQGQGCAGLHSHARPRALTWRRAVAPKDHDIIIRGAPTTAIQAVRSRLPWGGVEVEAAGDVAAVHGQAQHVLQARAQPLAPWRVVCSSPTQRLALQRTECNTKFTPTHPARSPGRRSKRHWPPPRNLA